MRLNHYTNFVAIYKMKEIYFLILLIGLPKNSNGKYFLSLLTLIRVYTYTPKWSAAYFKTYRDIGDNVPC